MKYLFWLWQKAKTYAAAALKQLLNLLSAVIPDRQKRISFYALSAFSCLFLFYIIAVIDMGIWCGSLSPMGMIRGYRQTGRSYPFLFFLILTVGLVIAMIVYMVRIANGDTGRGFSLSSSNVYGSAREITKEELDRVAHIVPKEAALGTILGQMDDTETKLITPKKNPNYNGNIVIFGPPGSGKSFCFVKPTVLQAIRDGRSVIVTDTKGEIFADTVEFARSKGYVIRRIDLRNPQYSDGWAILQELRWDDMRALIAARIVMENTGSDNDIHAAAEESLFRAICLYTERNPMIPKEEKTIYNAMAMLYSGAEALDKKFEAIKSDNTELRVAYDAYCSFKNGSQNLRGNIITNLANRLQVLSSPPVKELTSTADVDLSLPGKVPCIYYLCVSDQHETMKFVASMFYSFAFLDLVDYADQRPDMRLPVNVTFLMEEFANLGVIPNIDKYLSTCRSRNIDIMLVAQSLAQLQKVYEEESTNIMLAACATHLCIGYNDKATADYYEWRSGEASVAVKTEQHIHGEGPMRYGRGYSTGDGRRNMYTGHELMTIPPGKILIVWQRYNAMMANTFGFNRHPAYLNGEVRLISPVTRIKLSDRVAKAFFREMEDRRVEEYRQWVEDGGDPWPDYTEPKPKYDGPARGTKPPTVIPWPDLEEMALNHSEEVRTARAEALLKAMKIGEPQEADFLELPDDIEWQDIELLPALEEQPKPPKKEKPKSTKSASQEKSHQGPLNAAPAINSSSQSTCPIVLDDAVKPMGASQAVFGVPGEDLFENGQPTSTSKTRNKFGNPRTIPTGMKERN